MMKKDWTTNTVTNMDPDEVALFVMYRAQMHGPNGRRRDDLPHSPAMNNLLAQYNQQTASNLTHEELWLKLRVVLKCGEDRIEQYLSANNIPFPPKT